MNKTEIILSEWDKGDNKVKKQLEKHRLVFEAFAYNCMERLEEELEKQEE